MSMAQQAPPDCMVGLDGGQPGGSSNGSVAVRDSVLLHLFADRFESFDECDHQRCRQIVCFCQDPNFPTGIWQG